MDTAIRRLIMMTLLGGLPDGVVGVAASGQVNAKDYENVLIPAIEQALGQHQRVRFLYHLTPSFTGFSPGAMWDDMKVGMAHLTAWEKVAVVTDLAWIANATKMFGFAMPGLVKVFGNAEMDEARAWIVS
jgi:hypothetical protein